MKHFTIKTLLLVEFLLFAANFVQIEAQIKTSHEISKFQQENNVSKILLDKNGIPSFIECNINLEGQLADGVEKSFRFFDRYGNIFKMTNPRNELSVVQSRNDELGMVHVKFHQIYNGIKVYAKELITHYAATGELKLINGEFLPDLNISVVPMISKDEAERKAVSDISLSPNNNKPLLLGTELIIFPLQGKIYLTWKILISVDHPAQRWEYFVSATDGKTIYKADRIMYNMDLLKKGNEFEKRYDIYDDNQNDIIKNDTIKEYKSLQGASLECGGKNGLKIFKPPCDTCGAKVISGKYKLDKNDGVKDYKMAQGASEEIENKRDLMVQKIPCDTCGAKIVSGKNNIYNNNLASPDLAATKVYMRTSVNGGTEVSTPTVGQQVYFHVDFGNISSVSTNIFRWIIRLDGNDYCYYDQTAAANTNYIGWCTNSWTATSGTHTLTAVIDVNNQITESNENNNSATKSFTISGGSPDLAATKVYMRTSVNGGTEASTPTVGQQVYFHVDFGNISSVSTNIFRWIIRLDGNDYCYYDQTAAANTNYIGWCTNSWTATSGTHTLTAVIDVNNQITESNENNNSATKSFTVGNTTDNDFIATGIGVMGDQKSHIDTYGHTGAFQLVDRTRRANNNSHNHNGQMSSNQSIETKQYLINTPMTDEDNIWNNSSQATYIDAHVYAGVVYDYFLSQFGRNSYDNKGSGMLSIVERNDETNNAFWDGTSVTFNTVTDGHRPMSGSIDIVAHEWGHAITSTESGLIYEKESGALNESFSDMIAIAAGFATGIDPDWQQGENYNINGTAMRDLSNPHSGTPPQPDTYLTDVYWKDVNNCTPDRNSNDYCWVHYNSGVPNKAFYLLSQGGTQNGVNVTGIGISNAIKIMYRANVNYWTSSTNFENAKQACISAANDLDKTGNWAIQTQKAWEAVNVGTKGNISINTTTLANFGNVQVNTSSISQNYIVNGNNLTSNLIITAPSGFQVSKLSNSEFGSSVALVPNGGTIPNTTIYVRFTPITAQTYNGIITNTSTGATTQNVSVSGTGVLKTPTIVVSTTSLNDFGNISVGQSSASLNYIVSGSNLTANLVVSPPNGFKVSKLNNSGFESSVTLTPSGGAISNTNIYVIFTPTVAKACNGNITNTSSGATAQNISVSGTGINVSSASINPIISSTTISKGAEFWVEVKVGDPNIINDLYGISFQLSSDNSSCAYVDGNATNGDFLGSSPLFFARLINNQTTEIAVTKTSAPGASGSGMLAKAKFTCSTDITTDQTVVFSLSNITATNSLGIPISMNPTTTTVTIKATSTVNVWPGDCNNDLKVNSADILPVGQFYGQTTSSANNFGLQWQVYNREPWELDGITPQRIYADANGDGIINASDILPVGLNYGKTHSSSVSLILAKNNNIENAEEMLANASLKLVGPSKVKSNLSFTIQVIVGDPAMITDLYGISFQIRSDKATCNYIDNTAQQGLFFGNNTLKFFQKVDPQSVDVALTKTSTPGNSGSGTIATFEYISRIDQTVTFSLSNVSATDSQGKIISLDILPTNIVVDVRDINEIPKEYTLLQNFPNPFNPTTSITFSIPRSTYVSIKIYNSLGVEVNKLIEREMLVGIHQVTWDGKNIFGQQVSSGVYYYTLLTEAFRQTRKMILLK